MQAEEAGPPGLHARQAAGASGDPCSSSNTHGDDEGNNNTDGEDTGGGDTGNAPGPQAVLPMAGEEEVEALDITSMFACHPGEDASHSTHGGDFFGRACEVLAQMERDFREHEAEMAKAQASFREAARESSTQHRVEEAVLDLKQCELERLREEMAQGVTALDISRTELRAKEALLGAKDAELDTREASSDDVAARLQKILVAVLTRE